MTNFPKILSFLLLLFLLPVNVFAGNPLEKQVVYLSGTDNEHTVKWDFFCTGGRISGVWAKIDVPACWEQMGFGTYNYGRDSFNYGDKFKFADEKGLYKHAFDVPADWAAKEIYIVFEGSMTDTEVKINGKVVGPTHRGSFYRFKYNISDKLVYGKKNMLDVEVSKWSADSSVNEAERTADYWIFGGIFRPVYLEVLPKAFIERVAIHAEANGQFAMDVFPKNLKANAEITAEIIDANGAVVATSAVNATPADSLLTLSCKVNSPLIWTSETPHMYKVKYALKNKGKVAFRGSEKFGFRTIEIKHGDGVYVNGTKIKFKGTNRHVWWPETGRTVSARLDLMDVKLIKEMNMNAVRCSHYPPDQSFLDICDSLGLYVFDELAGWQDAYSTEAGAPLVREMVIRDVNHPSIIFWSNGNEGGTNLELDDDYLVYDPSKRPVIHAHHRPGNHFNGIDCNHYENFASTQKILNDSLIYMPTEFLHCQDDGGGGAGLEDYWELMWRSPRSAGGFLWAFIDEGLVRTDLNNIVDVDGVNAEDGVLGPHREKEGSFFAIRDIFTPIKVSDLSYNTATGLTFMAENRYHYTPLDKCTFTWKTVEYYLPNETMHGHKVMASGIIKVSAAPLQKTGVQYQVPGKLYDAIILEAADPFGNPVMKWVVKTKAQKDMVSKIISTEVAGPVKFAETDTTLVLEANQVQITLSKKTGLLTDVKTNLPNKLNFKNGPVLVNGNAVLTGFTTAKNDDEYTVEFKFTGNMEYIRWKMFANGWLTLDYKYNIKGKYSFTGVSFDFPEAHMQSAKWLGNGPYRVWKNRPQGVSYNVWENAYNNTQTGSSPWVYPEFKGYFADVAWMEFKTVEAKFYMVSNEENLFVRLFDFYAMPGLKPYPVLPTGNISFLDCIPPVGTKMAVRIDGNAAMYGPMGEPNQLDTAFTHTLHFYFEVLK